MGKDGLDESHWLISGGLISEFEMTPLSKDISITLTGPFSSAVDHIYVAGPMARKFSAAEALHDGFGRGFGSDHLPVITVLKASGE